MKQRKDSGTAPVGWVGGSLLLVALTLISVSCTSVSRESIDDPRAPSSSEDAEDAEDAEDTEDTEDTCPICLERPGEIAEDAEAIPPVAGEERLHAFVVPAPSFAGTSDGRGELALALVIGRGEQLERTGSSDTTTLAVQRDRVKRYLKLLNDPPRDLRVLRKELLAWSLCICPSDQRCQGGRDNCVRCTTCDALTGIHGAGASEAKGQDWPQPNPGQPGMGGLAADCPPKNVVLAIDVSGSMANEQKLRRLKVALKESLRHFMAGDVFSLVAFNQRAWVEIPPTTLKAEPDSQTLQRSRMPLLMSSKLPVDELVTGPTPMERTLRRFVKAIDDLRANGQTDLRQALTLATETLQETPAQQALLRDPRAINRVLLFTDGLHKNRRSTPAVRADFHGLVHEMVSKRISVSTFGVGLSEFDEQLLASCVHPSLEHSGRYYYVRDPGRVRGLLWDDLMATPMVRDAQISVSLSPDVEVLQPGPFTLPGRSKALRLGLGTLSVDEKRALAVRLRSPARRRASAKVRLTYTDPGGRRRVETRSVDLSAVANDASQVPVLEELMIQEVRDAFAGAVARLDEEDPQAAARALRSALLRLDQWKAALESRGS